MSSVEKTLLAVDGKAGEWDWAQLKSGSFVLYLSSEEYTELGLEVGTPVELTWRLDWTLSGIQSGRPSPHKTVDRMTHKYRVEVLTEDNGEYEAELRLLSS